MQSLTIVVAFFQNGQPAESGLGPFENQHLKEPAVVIAQEHPTRRRGRQHTAGRCHTMYNA